MERVIKASPALVSMTMLCVLQMEKKKKKERKVHKVNSKQCTSGNGGSAKP